MAKATAKARHGDNLSLAAELNFHIVGDFGLATSSLAAVDPSDVSPHAAIIESDMTLGLHSPPCCLW